MNEEKVSLGLCVCGFKCMWSVTVVAFRIANSADGNWLVNHRNVVFDRCVARWRDSLRHRHKLYENQNKVTMINFAKQLLSIQLILLTNYYH